MWMRRMILRMKNRIRMIMIIIMRINSCIESRNSSNSNSCSISSKNIE